MIEADSEIIKPESLKEYLWLQTSDESLQHVEQEIAVFCPFICHEMHSGMGSSKNHPISLPSRVNPAMLSLILDYCRFHQVPGRSNKERKSFDEKFIRMGTKKLCELTSAADSLQLKPLVDLTSRALARVIEGKTPEEIREIFHLPDDLTEEEKLEPIKNTMDDPRIRLLNRLYARKRKELKEREKEKEVEEDHADERSVDDLLSFINGGNEDPKAARTSKPKKKNRKRKDHQKICFLLQEMLVNVSTGIKRVGNYEFDDSDIDDDIDPALKEKIDREVEDFARRLNSDWPERMQEILFLGQERRPLQLTNNGNGSMRIFT
ncbi:hypothetical protein MIMGU_mgv1a021666mg, partial [Erythranthe guttata]